MYIVHEFEYTTIYNYRRPVIALLFGRTMTSIKTKAYLRYELATMYILVGV